MATVTTHSRNRVNGAGRVLRDLSATDAVEGLDALHVVEWWRARHAKPLARVNANLRYYVKKVGIAEPYVTQRLKRFATIIDKLDRHPGMQLSRMEDIGGVRAVLPSQQLVDAVVDDLRRQRKWKLRRVREYVDGRTPGPKPDGYRAVHLVVEKDGCYVEIQLRTPWQDSWAQSVEQDTRRLGAGLKFGAGPDDLREYYELVSQFFAARERHEEPDQDLMARLANLYAATRAYFPDTRAPAPDDEGGLNP